MSRQHHRGQIQQSTPPLHARARIGMSSADTVDQSDHPVEHCGIDNHHRVAPMETGNGHAGPSEGGHTSDARAAARQSLKPSFRTQASALMKKNLTYQKRNWKANLCLVLSPVVFSVVLAIIQVVINGIFDDDRFRCGCQCARYESDLGDSWTLKDYNVNGTNFWPTNLTGPTSGKQFRVPSEVTCKQRDYGLCGLEYSEATSIVWCPIKNPVRIPTLAQIPAPTWRADPPSDWFTSPGRTADNQTDIEVNEDGDVIAVKAPNLPITIPYMGQNRDLATELVRLTINGDTSAQVIARFVNQSLLRLVGRYATMKYIDPTSFTYITPMMQVFGEENNTARFSTFNDDGDADLNLLGGVPLMGTSRRGGGQLQNDGAFSSARGSQAKKPAFSYLLDDCDAQDPLNQPVPAAMLDRFSKLSASANLCNSTSTPGSGCRAATVRAAMEVMGEALALTPFKCMSTVFKLMDNAQKINELLFAGYGRGTVEQQAVELRQNDSNIQQFPFAVDFQDTAVSGPAPKLRFNLWYNETDNINENAGWIRYRRLPAVTNAITNAFLNKLLDPDNQAPRPVARLLFLRDQPKDGTALAVDFSSFLGPLFYTWLSQMLLPVMVGLLVYEKEKNLRSMMKMQGLGDASYWIINYAYYFVIHFSFQLLVWLFGAALGISMFLLTQPGVIVLFYILFTNVQIAIAFLMHAIFSTSKAASVVTVVYVILTGLLGQFLLQPYIQSKDFARESILGLQIIVPFALFRGYYEMAAEALVGTYTSGPGLQFSKVRSVPQGMGAVYVIFLIEWIVLLIIAFYLEQVVNSGSGVKKHPLFFLDYILKRKDRGAAAAGDNADGAAHSEYLVPEAPEGEPGDVKAQREYAEQKADRSRTPIIAYRLGKTYAGRDGGPPKVACRNFSLAIPKGEVFGLLGPNGAGKSTSINMLIGFLTPTSGTAFIEGLDIRQEMDDVYTILGVCPQHDLLWETLTAREHLMFYGRLKNLKGQELEAAVDEALQSVNLFANKVGDKQVGGYSGGMKRRLSVAISLIGNPLVVFLDEPSTGLDPASRQQLWSVIKAAKADRAMVLTTHSMEEAEELCDRLGIFVDGALQCIGNPKELTARYGNFLILNITSPADRVDDVRRFVTENIAPSGKCTYTVGGSQTFEVPIAETDLAAVFRQMEAHRKKLGIIDFGCSNMTLEEVFIKISRHIGAETNDF